MTPELKATCIYEVNTRQFSPEGTFDAVTPHLPRIADMGVTVLWFMPVHPIGLEGRKGSLGSPYAVQDYTAINPEFGDLASFKRLVSAAHGIGLKVIIDWVPNHTAWDHIWVNEHPDWYLRNAKGEIESLSHDNGTTIEHWTDVIGLDYSSDAMRKAMIECMRYWIEEADIDGFRCDVAFRVPQDFWRDCRASLSQSKDLLMLAEGEEDWLNESFDILYDFTLFRHLEAIAKGKSHAAKLCDYLNSSRKSGMAKLTYSANHDTNSWHGSDTEIFGSKLQDCAKLAMLVPGVPLILGGQESRLAKRLPFFEKDCIDWNDYNLSNFYQKTLELRKDLDFAKFECKAIGNHLTVSYGSQSYGLAL